MFLFSRSLSWPLLSSTVGSLLLLFMLNLVQDSLVLPSSMVNLLGYSYNTTSRPSVPLSLEMYQVLPQLMQVPSVLVFTFLVIIFTLLPDVIIRYSINAGLRPA